MTTRRRKIVDDEIGEDLFADLLMLESDGTIVESGVRTLIQQKLLKSVRVRVYISGQNRPNRFSVEFNGAMLRSMKNPIRIFRSFNGLFRFFQKLGIREYVIYQ